MPGENKALVKRFFEEVCNARKLDMADELFSADHTYHDSSCRKSASRHRTQARRSKPRSPGR
jgi:hypothetical protein